MEHHPLVPVIRFWLKVAGLLLLALLWPECAMFGLFALAAANTCGSCCFSASCGGCTGVSHSQYQIVISGVSNNVCVSCARFNATFTVTYDAVNSSVSNCIWNATHSSICGATLIGLTSPVFGNDGSVGIIGGPPSEGFSGGGCTNCDCDTVTMSSPSAPGQCNLTLSTAVITGL